MNNRYAICRTVPVFLLMIALLSVMGCKTNRQMIKQPIKEQGAEYLFQQLKDNELRFKYLSARFSAELIEDKKKTTFSGQLRFAKDSLFWISVSPAMGIEIIRIMVTNDSVKYMNRIEKNYFSGDIEYLNRMINGVLDFDMLQAFITGNDFSFYENGKFKADIDGNQYRLSTAGRSKLKKYVVAGKIPPTIPIQNIWLNPENFKITQVMIKEIKQEGRKLNAYYSDFEKVGNQNFPHQIVVEIDAEKKMVLKISYSKVTKEDSMRFPFAIPSRYKLMN